MADLFRHWRIVGEKVLHAGADGELANRLGFGVGIFIFCITAIVYFGHHLFRRFAR